MTSPRVRSTVLFKYKKITQIYLMWEHTTIPESLDLCSNLVCRLQAFVVGKGL